MLGFIPEIGICNTADFRPGNISPQTGVLNQLRKAVMQTKAANKRITRVRLDSAGHQNKVFKFCEEENICYYISLDKNSVIQEIIEEISQNKWRDVEDSDKEWAQSLYSTEKGSTMRILILRWKNPQTDLFNQQKHCYHIIGTNDNEIKPMDWLKFHNGRMNSENYNKELKEGLNAGCAPSHNFEIDRFYFLLNVLAYNILQTMKLFYLSAQARNWTAKTLRYWFINVCGKITRTGRKYYCKIINATDRTCNLFKSCLLRLRTIS